jgi:FkbM family methyltransferase
VAGRLPHHREEQLVRAFFGGAENGFYVEVGVRHPTEGSQSWHLETAGWTGVLVEPQPDLAAFLVTARKAKVFAVACSSPDNAGRSTPLAAAGPLSSIESGRMAPGAIAKYLIMVPTRTLDSVLEEAEAPTPIDLLSLDVEGHELEALLGFDFKRWRIEDNVFNLHKRRFLKESGYRLIRHVGNKGWYVPVDAPTDVSWNDRRGMVRKYYLALPFRMARNALRRAGRLIGDWWSVR